MMNEKYKVADLWHMMAYLLKMIESLQGLVSGRIHKINQPENDTIIIVIRQNRKNHQLLLSIHP